MRDSGVISGVSVAHDRTNVREIEAASSNDVRTVAERLLIRDDVSEALSLQTCNRAEVYVVTNDATDGRCVLDDFAPDIQDGSIRHVDHEETLRHLIHVVSGLESLVLGEDQILGQAKAGIKAACEQDAIGPMLEDALMKAVRVGERTHDETAVNEGTVSLGSAAVRLARDEPDAPIDRVRALVVGAGEIGMLATKVLALVGVDGLVVANRAVTDTRHLARRMPGVSKAVGLGGPDGHLRDADLTITATSSPDHVVTPNRLDDAGETMLIDITQPQNVDPDASGFAGVRVRDIDDLETVTDRTAKRRERAVSEVEVMVDEEFDRLLAAYKRKRADEAISSMYEAVEHVKRRGASTALSRLESQGDLTDERRETVESLAGTLVGQILTAPTKSLRDTADDDDWTTIQTTMQLFNPDFGDLEASESAGPSGPSIEFSGEPPGDLDRGAFEGEVSRRVLEQLSDD